jgi:hypothetical protein
LRPGGIGKNVKRLSARIPLANLKTRGGVAITKIGRKITCARAFSAAARNIGA